MAPFTWNARRAHWYMKAIDRGDYPRAFLPLFSGLLRPSDSVLDIGAGIGALSLLIAPQVRTVTAVDSSIHAIRMLEALAQEREIHNIVCVTAAWGEFVPEPHDVVIAAYAGKNVVGSAEALLSLTRAAVRLVVAVVPVQEYKTEFRINELAALLGKPPLLTSGTSGDVREALRALGCSPRSQVFTYEFGQPFDDADEAAEFLGEYLGLSDAEKAVVRAWVEPRLVVRDGGLYLPSTRTSEVLWWRPEEVRDLARDVRGSRF